MAGEPSAELIEDVEKLDAPELKLKHSTWYICTMKNARKYPYGYTAITFTTSYDRKAVPKFNGHEVFEQPKGWYKLRVDKYTNRVIVVFRKKEIVLGLSPLKVTNKSLTMLTKMLKERAMNLRCNLSHNDPEEGFVFWELV